MGASGPVVTGSCDDTPVAQVLFSAAMSEALLGAGSRARFMMVYKTPTIVSTDLFDLEKLGAQTHHVWREGGRGGREQDWSVVILLDFRYGCFQVRGFQDTEGHFQTP